MIRRVLRRVTRRKRPRAEGATKIPVTPTGSSLPFDMFDVDRTEKEARSAEKLERLYHKGQRRVWNGKDVLAALVEKHGGVDLPDDQREAIRAVFAIILWGELAAWKISTDLATHLQDLEAKMAATSQAHDEARHFYVMHDYLKLLGEVPTELGPATREVLEGTLAADTLAKKLMGMQMMVEPLALTLFHAVRKQDLEPVLTDLLPYYERDEARHVALGVLHLPRMIEGLGPLQALALWRWQIRQYLAQFAMLHELAPQLEVLGLHPREMLNLGREKQILAAKMLMEQMGYQLPVVQLFRALTDVRAELEFPWPGQSTRRRDRVRRAVRALMQGSIDDVEGELSEVASAA
jgi:hypothetical protein